MSGIRGAIQKPLLERMADKFTIGDECWNWHGSLNDAGYGMIYRNDTRRPDRAHRVMYELLVGPIPVGLTLDHLCRNRKCCRPQHLEPVTRGENVRRGVGPQLNRERALAKTHCKWGHEWNETNTKWERQYRKDDLYRVCRVCTVNRERAKRRQMTRADYEASLEKSPLRVD